MNNPQPFTTVHAMQTGYALALRDLDPYIEALIDTREASVDCIRNPDEYYRNKDEAEYAVRNYRHVRRRVAVEMGLDELDPAQ